MKLFIRKAGDYRPATHRELMVAARRALAVKFKRGSKLNHAEATSDYLRVTFGAREYECFVVILLDSRHRVLVCLEMFRGTVDAMTVHPREVVKAALRHNAASAIVAHNHPSGVAAPSAADELLTRRLKDALALVDIRLVDHLVVAGEDVASFAERGLL